MPMLFEFQSVQYLEVLKIETLKLESGGVTSILGPSGSGKTTLLRLLNKMISPTSGEVFYEGKNLASLDSVRHRREVVMLSQQPVMLGDTLRENLTAGLRLQGRTEPTEDVLLNLLETLKLAHPLDASVLRMSGGEKQRLALGRVLLLDPKVFLLDEPSSALDEATASWILSFVTDHVRQTCKTLLMVTHSSVMARQFSDRRVELMGGRLREEDRL